MILRLISIISIVVLNLTKTIKADGMHEVFQWKQMDYYNRGDHSMTKTPILNKDAIYFPDYSYVYQTNNNTSYIAYNNVPMGATHYKGRLFMTIPRRRHGIPSTLNYIDLNQEIGVTSPKLIAYPDFETNQLTSNSEHLVSVYRTSVDNFSRLWFIDTGMLEYPNNFTQTQRPAIWVIDLNTDNVIRRFEIPTSVAAEGRGLASITPDTDNGYDKTFAYIPDLLYNRLHVYSFELDKIWSFEHNYFHFDPIAGDLNIGGYSFRWNDGIFSISLGPKLNDGSRSIFFHAMASNYEFYVNNTVLQDEKNAQRADHGSDFHLIGRRGDQKQSTMHKYDPRTGVLFYTEIQTNSIGCWNINKPFTPDYQGKVAQDQQKMIYPSDLTIDEDGVMWVVTNSMPIFIYSTLDSNKFNFHVWKQDTKVAVYNTVCR